MPLELGKTIFGVFVEYVHLFRRTFEIIFFHHFLNSGVLDIKRYVKGYSGTFKTICSYYANDDSLR